jgi:hypothetical protein
LIERTDAVITRCLRSIGLQLEDVDKIILIGGTSRFSFIKDYWQAKLNPAKQQLIYHEPMNAVAYGAALYAASLVKDAGKIVSPIELHNVSTYTIALKDISGHGAGSGYGGDSGHGAGSGYDILINKNSPLPVKAVRHLKVGNTVRQFIALELCQFWDPEDEIFRLGVFRAGPFNWADEYLVELTVENRANGTIGIKLRNMDNGKEIKPEFETHHSGYEFNFEEQKAFLNELTINSIF